MQDLYLPLEVFAIRIIVARIPARCPLLHFLYLLVNLQLLGVFPILAL